MSCSPLLNGVTVEAISNSDNGSQGIVRRIPREKRRNGVVEIRKHEKMKPDGSLAATP